jgi:hypothetical protein
MPTDPSNIPTTSTGRPSPFPAGVNPPPPSGLPKALGSPTLQQQPDALSQSLVNGLASNLAGMPPLEAPLQQHWALRAAQLQAEYVSGGGFIYLANYIRSLPQYIDDTTRDLGDDLYERMLLDPQVNSAIRLLKLSSLSNGVRLEPAVELDNDEYESGDDEEVQEDNQPRNRVGQYRELNADELQDAAEAAQAEAEREKAEVEAELAGAICDFCTECLENLNPGFLEVLYDLLDALALGNRVAEQVYALDTDDDGKQRLALKSLKVKPRQVVAFVVDPFMNVIGLQAMIPGKGYPVVTGSVVGDPSQLPNLLPREKFAVLTWNMVNGDPRGNSLLRPVYNPWWMKMQTWGEIAKYLAQFAGPSLIGTTAPGSVSVPTTDSMGNIIPGAPLVTPEQAMLASLMNFRNGSVVAFPAGAKVDPINMSGDGQAFLSALNQFNGEISKGILCQTLATSEGVHDSRAASEVHQDVLDLVVNHVRQTVAGMIRRDILVPLVRYNWGDAVAKRLTPKVHLSQSQQHNWAKDAAAVSALVQASYLDPSQYKAMDARLGLPPRKTAPTVPAPAPVPAGGAGVPSATAAAA